MISTGGCLSDVGGMREVFSSAEALTAYAASKGQDLPKEAAEALVLQAREQMRPGGLQALSDDSLDHVSGAGWKQIHWS
ncbi:hypothetical protein DFO45_3061 [Azorhizobium sp. AG788]|nr:hypothetical protein DFO45_3061 [Azorhizobium sp. AG788]